MRSRGSGGDAPVETNVAKGTREESSAFARANRHLSRASTPARPGRAAASCPSRRSGGKSWRVGRTGAPVAAEREAGSDGRGDRANLSDAGHRAGRFLASTMRGATRCAAQGPRRSEEKLWPKARALWLRHVDACNFNGNVRVY